MLKNINQLYIIKDKYMNKGTEYYILDFPMKAPMAYWTHKVWPDIVAECSIIKSGTTAVILDKKDLQIFDKLIGRHKEMFYLRNKNIKGIKMSYQIGLLEKQKGYYPENN